MARIKTSFVFTVLLCLAACGGHSAYVHSIVDLTEIPSRSDPIFLELPDNPSIRERNLAVLLKDELVRNGFNLVSDFRESKWILSFALGRNTYTIGSSTHATAVGFSVGRIPIAVGSSKTEYVQQTDVSIFMHLFRTADLEKPNPMTIWEGSVTTKDRVFSVLPNSTVKILLDKFGKNFEREAIVKRSYQRDVNRQINRKP